MRIGLIQRLESLRSVKNHRWSGQFIKHFPKRKLDIEWKASDGFSIPLRRVATK